MCAVMCLPLEVIPYEMECQIAITLDGSLTFWMAARTSHNTLSSVSGYIGHMHMACDIPSIL